MRQLSHWLLIGAVASNLLGCSALYRSAEPEFLNPPTRLSADDAQEGNVMYHYLLGQIAGTHSSLAEQNRDEETMERYLDVAVPNLVIAAEHIEDSAAVEHATKAAAFANEYDYTLRAAKRWIELQPNETRAYQYAAIASVRLGQKEEAQTYLAVVVELAPSLEDGILDVGGLLSREAEEEPTLTLLREVTAEYPDQAASGYVLASALMRHERYEEAIQNLDASLAVKPDYRGALLLKARALYQLNRVDDALGLLKKHVQLKPSDSELRTTYARMLITERRFEEARDQYETLFKSNPQNIDLAYRLGMLTLELKQFDLADKYFKHVLRSGQRSYESLYYLGRTAEQVKDYKQALQYYMRVSEGEYRLEALLREAKMLSLLDRVDEGLGAVHALQAANQDPGLDIRFYLAQVDILVEQKMYQRAYQLLSEALGKHKKNFDLLYTRTMIAEKLGKVDESIKDLRYLLKQQPDNPDLMNALGYTLANRTEQFEEAKELIEKALQLKPDSAAVTDSMGWVLFRMGQIEEAEKYLRKAYALDPDPEIAGHLGEVLWHKGQRQEARSIWDKALQTAPDHDILNAIIQQYQ